MAVGGSSYEAVRSYVALGKEGTFGTYASATTAVEAISCSFKTEIESQKLDQICANRGYSHRVTLNKNVRGSLEQYLHPQESLLLIANALGGPIISTSLTAASSHSITSGNYDTTTAINSLSFNVRKGQTQTFRYTGGKVNTLKISGSVGEPIKLSAEIIFKDSTLQADDISSTLSISSVAPYTFAQGAFRYTSSEASLTSTVAEPIQSFELSINNNIVSGEDVRSLGTIIPDVLPATRRNIEFKITNRWDTTTTFNRFIQATLGSIELIFTGVAISSEHNYGMTIRIPKVYNNTGDTEISGGEDILKSDISFDVLVDNNVHTTTSRDIGFTIKNNVVAY